MVIAFDADVLIYASQQGNPTGAPVAALFADEAKHSSHETGVVEPVGIGSALLLPELLIKPLRRGQSDEYESLASFLGRLELRPFDAKTAILAVSLGATYGMRTADAAHLATAINSGADYFLTNNRKDFPQTISEISVVYPTDLPL